MVKKKLLESSMRSIEERLSADPRDVGRMIEARMLSDGLGDINSRKRAEVRARMLSFGTAALPGFLFALTTGNSYARWQAAKALSRLHEPETAPDLVNAMEDEDFGVRWLAAEGLIAMGPVCLLSVLQGLRMNFASARMRNGVRHILHELADKGYCRPSCERLLHSLQHSAPEEEIAWAAEETWEEIRAKPKG
jgi:hypothetical protein